MIWIKKSTTNIVIVTLWERVTLTAPHYLLTVYSEQSKVTAAVVLSDVSSFPERYQQFSIREPQDLNLIPARYRYSFYEQSSPTNLDPAQAGTLLETGILTCWEDQPVSTVYDDPKTNVIYNG